jgi:hypothetical protein
MAAAPPIAAAKPETKADKNIHHAAEAATLRVSSAV